MTRPHPAAKQIVIAIIASISAVPSPVLSRPDGQNREWDHARQKRFPKRVFQAGTFFQEIGQEDSQRQLGDLGWLRRHAAEFDPTPRPVHRREGEDCQQQKDR